MRKLFNEFSRLYNFVKTTISCEYIYFLIHIAADSHKMFAIKCPNKQNMLRK